MSHPKVIAEPSPDEIKEAAQRLNERFQDLTADDARMYAMTVMFGDRRVDRMVLEMVQRDAKINILMAEVREWLCPGCNSVYSDLPGPKDNALTRFRCPQCGSNVGLMNTIRLRKEREERRAERRNMEAKVAAFSALAAESSQAVAAIAQRERAFLIDVAEKAHEWHLDHPNPYDWRKCRQEPCKMLYTATYDRETAEEQERAREAYERAVGRA